MSRAQDHGLQVPEEVLDATQASAPPLSILPGAEESADSFKAKHSLPVSTHPSSPAPKSKVEVAQPEASLVMYEHGKVVFRGTPSEVTSQVAVTGDSNAPEAADLPRPATNSYVLTRVVPTYPEEARQQRVQGPVVMNVLVGTDGSVQNVEVVSGDPRLAQAAVDSVRQWRFRPHNLKSNPVEFETRITVNFSLS
jgi:TonB family protein